MDSNANNAELTDRPWSTTSLLAGLALMVLGFVLRLYDLDGKELWLDEANAVIIAQSALPELLNRLAMDSSPPLFYLMLHYWHLLFGDSEVALRLFSVVGGVLGIGLVYAAGRQLFSTSVGALTGLYLACSPAHVDYSQQVRQYTWLSFSVIASTWLLWRLLHRPTRWGVVGYVFFTSCALMLHNHALYLLPVHGVFIAYGAWQHRARRPLLLGAYGLTVFLYLPWLQHLLTQVGRMDYLSWLARWWEAYGSIGVLKVTAMSYVYGPPWTYQRPPSDSALWLMGFAGIGAVCAWFVGPRLQALWRERTVWSLNADWVIWWSLFGPLGTAYGLSFVLSMPNYIPGRTDQMVYPLFLMVLAQGLLTLPLTLFRKVAASVIFVTFGYGFQFYFFDDHTQGSRQAVTHILAQTAPARPIVFTGLNRAALQYYLEQKSYEGALVSFPRHFEQHLGNHRPEILLSEPDALKAEAVQVLNQVDELLGDKDAFYLVYALFPPINTASFMKQAIDNDPRFERHPRPKLFHGHRQFSFQLVEIHRSSVYPPVQAD